MFSIWNKSINCFYFVILITRKKMEGNQTLQPPPITSFHSGIETELVQWKTMKNLKENTIYFSRSFHELRVVQNDPVPGHCQTLSVCQCVQIPLSPGLVPAGASVAALSPHTVPGSTQDFSSNASFLHCQQGRVLPACSPRYPII